MSFTISRWNSHQILTALDPLSGLLKEVVEDGASIGFLAPLEDDASRNFWISVAKAVESASRIVLVALDEGQIIGSVQLDLDTPPNGPHRAEVRKLMVAINGRRRGVARALMLDIEEVAREHRRSLLVLDTCSGTHAEKLYRSLGWEDAGMIPNFALISATEYCTTQYMYRQITL